MVQSVGAAAPGARSRIAHAERSAATHPANAQLRVIAVLLAAVALTAIIGLVRVGTGATTTTRSPVTVARPVASHHVLAQDRSRLWAADLAARRVVEHRLLGNFEIRATSAARRALAAGRIDLRAATVLALLAGRGPVTVLAAHRDPAEQAADLPVRTLDLRVDPGAAQDIRSGLPPAYQPQVVQNLAGGVERWKWPLRSLPVGHIGGAFVPRVP